MKLTSLLIAFFTAAIITGCSKSDSTPLPDWATAKTGIYYDDTKPNIIEVSKTDNQKLEFTCDYCEGNGRPHKYITLSNVILLTDSTISIIERVDGITYTGDGAFSDHRLEYHIDSYDTLGSIVVGNIQWFRGDRN